MKLKNYTKMAAAALTVLFYSKAQEVTAQKNPDKWYWPNTVAEIIDVGTATNSTGKVKPVLVVQHPDASSPDTLVFNQNQLSNSAKFANGIVKDENGLERKMAVIAYSQSTGEKFRREEIIAIEDKSAGTLYEAAEHISEFDPYEQPRGVSTPVTEFIAKTFSEQSFEVLKAQKDTLEKYNNVQHGVFTSVRRNKLNK